MKNKLLILMIVSLLLVVPLISADFIPHKQNTPLTLTFTSNNATTCSLLDIQYPNGDTINYNLTLDKTEQSFSTTLNESNYTLLGDTCHFVSCFDGVKYETGSICREVTPSGFSDTLGFYFVLILVAGAFIFLGFKIQDGWFVVAGGMAFVLIGLYSINFGIAGQRDMFITWGVGLFEIFMGAYLSMRASFEIMETD